MFVRRRGHVADAKQMVFNRMSDAQDFGHKRFRAVMKRALRILRFDPLLTAQTSE